MNKAKKEELEKKGYVVFDDSLEAELEGGGFDYLFEKKKEDDAPQKKFSNFKKQ